MILFDTEPDIAAFVETNLKTQEKIAVSGYTWDGFEKIGSIKKDYRGIYRTLLRSMSRSFTAKIFKAVNYFCKKRFIIDVL